MLMKDIDYYILFVIIFIVYKLLCLYSYKKYTLGSRMKMYEKDLDLKINSKYILVRLDGHNFKKLSSYFNKTKEQPFNPLFVDCMVKTAVDCFTKFNALFAFVCSDEITLLFDTHKNNLFNGRINKILSLIPSYATLKFNSYLREKEINIYRRFMQAYDNYCYCGDDTKFNIYKQEYYKFKDLINNENYFDGRIIQMNKKEILNNIIWRQRDCLKNSITTYALQYYINPKLQYKNSTQKIQMMKFKDFDYEKQVPIHLKYGVFIKKEQYLKENKFIRNKVSCKSFKLCFTDINLNFIFCKFWNDITLHDTPITFNFSQLE